MFNSCYRKTRLKEIKKLRQWRDKTLALTNHGQKKQAIFYRPEVYQTHYSGGWTQSFTIVLGNGYEIVAVSTLQRDSVEDQAIKSLYAILRSRFLSTGNSKAGTK